MNSIVLTHVSAITNEEILHAALARLGAYLDNEARSLEALLTLTGQAGTADDIQSLHALHLDSEATAAQVHQLLTDARTVLIRLLNVVQAIPHHSPVERAPSDFEAWHRWTGARLQDIATILSRALSD